MCTMNSKKLNIDMNISLNYCYVCNNQLSVDILLMSSIIFVCCLLLAVKSLNISGLYP